MDCFTHLAEFSKRSASFTSNWYIMLGHWSLQFFLWTFLFQTCEHWWLRFPAALLLVHLRISYTADYSCWFQNPSLAPQLTLQFCLMKCMFREIPRCGLELLPATHVPWCFAGWCWLTVPACSATLGPSKPPGVLPSTFSKLFQEPLTDSLKSY